MIALLVACVPLLEDDTPYVGAPRLLAVAADPPEVGEGAGTTLSALYAGADGVVADAVIDWSFCTAPKALAELGAVAPTCLDPDSADLLPIGEGTSLPAVVPADACSLFGPNPPPPQDGQPGGRPADPDVTGGYYQPVLAFTDVATLAAVRVRCGLANVSQETYIAWNAAYVSNANPVVEAIDADGVPLALEADGLPTTVVGGAAVSLTASWATCDAAPCGGAEPYVVYDVPSDALLARREAISATWFTSAGTFDEARNGRDGGDSTNFVTNTLTIPAEGGPIWAAVVLRDERGGVAFQSFRLDSSSNP